MDHDVWQRIYRHDEVVVRREIAGETLLVPVRGRLAQLHRIFVLNDVGAFIWEQIDGKRRLAGIREGLLERFEVSRHEAERDLLEYVEGLRDARLIVETS